MLFSSLVFIFAFLPIFLIVYFLAGMRTAVLLAGSAIFYTWGEGRYIFLLGGLIVLNFFLARTIARCAEGSRGRVLTFALSVDLLVLSVFKYLGFFTQVVNGVVPGLDIPVVELQLPLGISFFTFQLISYLVDVYRRNVEPERSIWRFATYILMFPHLIAGPIVRYSAISAELRSRIFALDKLGLGVQYFIVGLSQKVLVANSLAPVADYAFALSSADLSFGTAWVGLLSYTLQIYFDFCGYSNMAIGLAFMLGFTFPRNFYYPYAAKSITEFWRRWHISLSFWFRDYVYIPLGGSRGSRAATTRNLLAVFFLTGLWHGAAWNFILWGMFHGMFLLFERMGLGNSLQRTSVFVRSFYTLVVVMFGWVLFRVESMSHAAHYFGALLNPLKAGAAGVGVAGIVTPESIGALVVGCVLSWPVVPILLERMKVARFSPGSEPLDHLDTLNVHILSVPLLVFGFFLCCVLLTVSTLNPFLYFRF